MIFIYLTSVHMRNKTFPYPRLFQSHKQRMLVWFPVIKISDNRYRRRIGSPNSEIITLSTEHFTCMGTKNVIQTIVWPVLKIADVFIRKKGVIPNGFRGINKMC